MFPPIEASVLENNPDFANLYATLTTSILNPDGTTRADPAAKERDAVRRDLRTHRLKTAKHHLLTSALTSTSETPSSPLPEPVLDLLVLLPPMLTHPPTPGSAALLLSHPPFSSLPSLLPDLSRLISHTLRTSALALARIAHPSTNPSYLHRNIPTLPQTVADLLSSTADLSRRRIPDARAGVASGALGALLADHARALGRLVHALEAKLAAPRRELLLRAEVLPLAAEEAALRAGVGLAALERDVVYTAEVRGAAAAYARHLGEARARVGARCREVRVELAGYGVGEDEAAGRRGGGDEGRERVFREMGRVYGEMKRQVGEMKRQVGEVEGDLKRLMGR